MITTTKFRLYPSKKQFKKLNEIFTIYNKAKRIGYNLLFKGEAGIQQKLMEFCHNNPYVNTILIDNKTKLAQQKTWLNKRKTYLKRKILVVQGMIGAIKRNNYRDRKLRGLYIRLSSLQNKLIKLELKPIVFGTKNLFLQRIRRKISREEFIIHRDASFSCIGKVQYGQKNSNLKLLPSKVLKIRTFSKEKGKKWIIIPFSVNIKQERKFREILQVDKYTITVKRKFMKGDLRYYAHISYETPLPEIKYSFGNGCIGLDFNYNFIALANTNREGNFLSYQIIPFRNLHSYRKGRRDDYASFKLDKIINYCINKRKGLIIENLSIDQSFSYSKRQNRKLSNLRTSMLSLLERKCARNGIALRKVHPAYTSIIGELKYLRSYNLSRHILASYVIARRGLGFTETIPALYERLLAQVGDTLKPHLKPSRPYQQWAQLYDLFKHCGITSFNPSETSSFKPSIIMKKLVKNGVNPATGAPSDNLRAGLPVYG